MQIVDSGNAIIFITDKPSLSLAQGCEDKTKEWVVQQAGWAEELFVVNYE